ncbi:threonine--tRNA ligase [Oribacterium sp. oral taxon 078 str. F0262]|uniref:threonine--tRNA ligase n=1 Tax=Oribacterium sp. oral taxon 078 TaxID=652706 RepID=UPI0001BCB868|nr:aminoacyl--tRNA ligase-related protein [Oribacterium sp. oral taxon 078]EFE91118.1 threonine--tRNA ligase [Oribacterium sp. oral taxon 078 str. F0262]
MDKEQYLSVYRHSLAHILAKAVIELYGKDVQYAIGPEVEDGCYYDFVFPRPVTEENFKEIEDKMREIIRRKEPWTRRELSRKEALELFKDQRFKKEIIEDLPEDAVISAYYTGDDFVDLCRGPHVENSKELLNAAFQIKSTSGAYWRGDEHRDQLQRIYLYAFPDKEALKAHLKFVKEAQERDHKKLGAQLELFLFDETAPGMPYWLPRGWKMYQALLKYSREVQERHGYREIAAPLINNKKLWLISGHWAHYINNMFMVPGVSGWLKADAEIPGILENLAEQGEEPKNVKIQAGSVLYNRERMDTMAAKPMNCPNAMLTYKRKNRSYRELPIRYSEYDVLHRKEKSGQMNGLFRVQEFRQDDDHTFVMESQIEDEIKDIISIADEIYSTFGVSYRAELSTRPEDFMGDIEVWDRAEAALKRILTNKYGEGGFEINEGDGAFYGPKIDLQIKDALGREWQCGTIQLDFQLPHNFGLSYQTAEGVAAMPVVIHRAIYGSLERFIGIIIENFKGVFPFWLSSEQVGIVPIRTEHNAYAKKVFSLLQKHGIRVEADYSESNMKEKIKKYKNFKDPYILVLGDREAAENTVSINMRGSNRQLNNIPIERFLAMCERMNEEHSLELLESAD